MSLSERATIYRGESLRAVAMPLGGIGTGTVALCGDGSLRQWQLNNTVNHLAYVPHSFFAVRVCPQGRSAEARVLQSDALYHEAFPPIPCTNDYFIPEECKKLLRTLPGVQSTEFSGEYPLAQIRYHDDALPVAISLTSYSPFCPLDAETSGTPAVVFQFTATNTGDRPVKVNFLAALQNFIGWDGVQTIQGTECPQYGGNSNHVLKLRGMTAISMENTSLPPDHPKNGTLCLAALHPDDLGEELISAWAEVGDLLSFWQDVFVRESYLPSRAGAPSDAGHTHDGALSIPLQIAPGESKTATFLLCWHFPNRYVDYIQWFSHIKDPKSHFWIGNQYANRFASAPAVAEFVRDNFARLEGVTRTFQETFFDSSLPYEILDVVSSQMSIIRTPTCLWDDKGKFFGFEGCNGASTGGWNGTGGCCPMNCSHVFAYEWSLSSLFPGLERTMRETELFTQLHPTGYLPHRVTLPLYMPRAWDRKIGGPENPALDGLLSMVLKTYREHLRCTDLGWLEAAWPKIESAMDHLFREHDTDGDGVLKGEQPNTYDISIFGPNTFVGTLYLAALRAAEEMALRLKHPELALRYRERFEKGREGYSRTLWNGEYWIQEYDAEQNPEQNYGTGCHSDQLFGQWWAHNLGLGYLLPEDRVRTAVASIVRYNLRDNFEGHQQKPRQFASDDEPGLLVCSWPKGGRPEVPTLYSDEIWTGIEYEAAALCLYEGMHEEALKILRSVRSRYNGARRSPWNDIECGDHYIRALSSGALLDAACGYRYDATNAALTVAPRLSPESFRAFLLMAEGWGSVEIRQEARGTEVRLHIAWGEAMLQQVTIACSGKTQARAQCAGNEMPCHVTVLEQGMRVEFEFPLRLLAGEELKIYLS